MPLYQSPVVNVDGNSSQDWYRFFASVAQNLNAVTVTGTAAPTGNKWAQGNFCWNSTPTEQGTAGSKYVVLGWVCVASGTPGTWLPCRTLTGN